MLASCGENPTVLSKRPASRRQRLLGMISSKSARRSCGPVEAKAAHRSGSRTWQAMWKNLLHPADLEGVKGSWRHTEARRCGRFGVPTGRPKEAIGEGAALVTVGTTEYREYGPHGCPPRPAAGMGQSQPEPLRLVVCAVDGRAREAELPKPLEFSTSIVIANMEFVFFSIYFYF